MRSRLPVEFPCPRMMGRFRFLFSLELFFQCSFPCFLFFSFFFFLVLGQRFCVSVPSEKEGGGFFFDNHVCMYM